MKNCSSATTPEPSWQRKQRIEGLDFERLKYRGILLFGHKDPVPFDAGPFGVCALHPTDPNNPPKALGPTIVTADEPLDVRLLANTLGRYAKDKKTFKGLDWYKPGFCWSEIARMLESRRKSCRDALEEDEDLIFEHVVPNSDHYRWECKKCYATADAKHESDVKKRHGNCSGGNAVKGKWCSLRCGRKVKLRSLLPETATATAMFVARAAGAEFGPAAPKATTADVVAAHVRTTEEEGLVAEAAVAPVPAEPTAMAMDTDAATTFVIPAAGVEVEQTAPTVLTGLSNGWLVPFGGVRIVAEASEEVTEAADQPAGIMNLTKTDCFSNAVLQMLGVCPIVRDHLRNQMHGPQQDDNNKLTEETGKMLHNLYTRKREDEEPHRVVNSFDFLSALTGNNDMKEFSRDVDGVVDNMQHDAMSFLQKILETVLSKSVFDDTFGFEVIQTKKCRHGDCLKARDTHDPYGCLNATLEKGKRNKTLQSCLSHNFETRLLKVDVGVICPDCTDANPDGAIRAHDESYKLDSMPKVLLVQLLRFSHTSDRKPYKNKSIVDCPLDLDLSFLVHDAILDDVSKYRLFAAINHSGSLTSGHYHADVCYEGKWYNCNDKNVKLSGSRPTSRSRGSASSVRNFKVDEKEAFILAYHRADVDPVVPF